MDLRPHPSGNAGMRTCESCGERQPGALAALVEAERERFDCCPNCSPETFDG